MLQTRLTLYSSELQDRSKIEKPCNTFEIHSYVPFSDFEQEIAQKFSMPLPHFPWGWILMLPISNYEYEINSELPLDFCKLQLFIWITIQPHA